MRNTDKRYRMGLDTRKWSARAIPLIVLLLMSVPMIYADDPTLIDIEWGGDDVEVIYYIESGGDTSTWFKSTGAHISGELHFIDYNDAPGGFDTFETRVKAYVTGGGEIELQSLVIDTLAMSYTKIQTDEVGYLGWKTTVNSTHLLNFNSDDWVNGPEIQASGISFEVIHQLFNPDLDGISVKVENMSQYPGSIYINIDKEWVTGEAFESGIEDGNFAVGTGSADFKVEVEADNYLIGYWSYEITDYDPAVIGNGTFVMASGGYQKLELEYNYGFTLLDFHAEGD